MFIKVCLLQVSWVVEPGALPHCLPGRILEVYPDTAFHMARPSLSSAADDRGDDVITQPAQLMITAYGQHREPAAYFCLDHGIEDGSYLRLVALVCLDPHQLCGHGGASSNSCLNSCCPQDVYCQLPQLLRARGHVARPHQQQPACPDPAAVVTSANVTITDQVTKYKLQPEVCYIPVPMYGTYKHKFVNKFFSLGAATSLCVPKPRLS
jgi:hypothetical protein